MKVRHTSYLEVLQSVLVENVFNIHGLLASLLGNVIYGQKFEIVENEEDLNFVVSLSKKFQV